MRLENQAIVVTGGASGLGRAVVTRCLEEGARVAILDRSAERLDDLRKSFGNSLVATVGDVRNLTDNLRVVDDCISAFLVPETPMISIDLSSSNLSSMPQVRAPWAPPPCNARATFRGTCVCGDCSPVWLT
jgi:NAD(P)-dependent dehydrogenase (short-subunit alcohol dehydrogenase family)